MNIYDFDKTIYKSDSTADFYFYCLKQYPSVLLWLPFQAWSFFLYILGFYTKTQFKERFYRFFKSIPDIEASVRSFWNKKSCGIKKWYLENHRDDDIIISASPEFLLRPICTQLGINHLIASRVNPSDGRYDGFNCYGEEKVRRLHEQMGDIRAEYFYSDSLSDAPLAAIADKGSYIVSGDKLTEWDKYKPGAVKKIVKMIFDREFLSFAFVGVINTINGVLFAYLFSLIFDANIAFAAGYITSLTISYFLNSFITFRDTLSFMKYLKFAFSYVPNFVIQNVIVFVVYNLLGLDKVIAYILAGIIGVPVTFLMMKLLVFTKTAKK